MMEHRKKSIVNISLLVLLGSTIFFARSVLAQSPEEGRDIIIERRDSAIVLQINGDFTVTETWHVRFINGTFTFLTRVIDTAKFTAISDWQVHTHEQTYLAAQGGKPATFEVKAGDHQTRITWFFSPAANEQRSFTLQYTVHGGLYISNDEDLFQWDVIERIRSMFVKESHVKVHFPMVLDKTQYTIDSQRYWKTQPWQAQVIDGQTIEFTGSTFMPGDEWQIQIGFPHGFINAQPSAWQIEQERLQQAEAAKKAAIAARQQLSLNIALIVSTILLGVGGFVIVKVWYKFGRTALIATIAKAYAAPPEHIPPAWAGTILRGYSNVSDMWATLADLEQRGHLHMFKRENDEVSEIIIEWLNHPPKEVHPFEQFLLETIFDKPGSQKNLSSVSTRLYKQIEHIKTELYHQLVEQKYISDSPDPLRHKYHAIGLWSTIAAVVVAMFSSGALFARDVPFLLLIPATIMVLGIGILMVSHAIHRRTAQGMAAAMQWRSFKRHLEHLQQQGNMTNTYRGYAIAFGLQTFSKVIGG